MRLIAILLLCPLLCQAQPPTSYQPLFISSSNYVTPDYSLSGSRSSQFGVTITDASVKGNIKRTSPARGYLIAGVFGAALVDMNSVGGTAVGVFGFGEGTGKPGGLQDEISGIYGRADKNGPYWATGVHGECVIESPDMGGSCIGLNTELIGKNTKSLAIGINVQPRPEIRNAIGLQFQEPGAYRYAISMPNMGVKIGDVDTDDFCLRFDPANQRLEFWRACNRAWTTRVGYVDMNYGAPDVPLNR